MHCRACLWRCGTEPAGGNGPEAKTVTIRKEMVECLRGTTFLRTLSEDDLLKLAALCSRESFPAGAVVFEQGEVRQTAVELSRRLWSGFWRRRTCSP